jgi:hypothetical protein
MVLNREFKALIQALNDHQVRYLVVVDMQPHYTATRAG